MKPSPGLAKALAQLEDAAGWEGVAYEQATTPELRIQLSQAISLKRIADSVESVIHWRFNEPAIYTRRAE